MGTILIGIIRLYKLTLSPLLGDCCRFEPSCSEYCMQAIRIHGWMRGLLLGTVRIFKCHPFHPGGLDPVPAVADRNPKLSESAAGQSGNID